MTPFDKFFAWRRRRRLSRIAERAEKRREVLMEQIEYRRVKRKEFRPLYGVLEETTHVALAAECGREWPSSDLFPHEDRARVRQTF